ncbi:MAG TPA: hypothetical protein PLP18_02080 [Smithellaceae bacterium]|nr:hypothetical protein [Smithellaceae bacterium]
MSEHLIRSYTPIFYSSSISDYPAIGVINTIEVGESLVWKDKQTTIPSVDIEQAIEHPAENMGTKFTITLLPGRYVEKGKDDFGKYYEGKKGNLLANGQAVNTAVSNVEAGIYITSSDPKKTEIYTLPANLRPLSYPKDDIPFIKSFSQKRDELSFKKELVYTGIYGNVVSILYREFKEDIARPAFSQDLKYDLSESKIIGYRGARFEIIKATNQNLTYRTLKQLD